ncbi:MAG: hypothetical protein ACRDCA_26405 [Serratia sp. (in: enterobacteria)]|uniref:hypothetical protein n=1 Tax=Serratia sp. (in: enterobacteria) TaxID=616 RepID=UPI003F3589A5
MWIEIVSCYNERANHLRESEFVKFRLNLNAFISNYPLCHLLIGLYLHYIQYFYEQGIILKRVRSMQHKYRCTAPYHQNKTLLEIRNMWNSYYPLLLSRLSFTGGSFKLFHENHNDIWNGSFKRGLKIYPIKTMVVSYIPQAEMHDI